MKDEQTTVGGRNQGKTGLVMKRLYDKLRSGAASLVNASNIEGFKRSFYEVTGENLQAEFVAPGFWRVMLKK